MSSPDPLQAARPAPASLAGDAEAAEAERLAALRALNLLDTDPERVYDDISRLAASVCGAPIALVSLVDEERQWFKSRVGLDACETPRAVSFCAHAIKQPGLLVVPDARADPRFAGNPLVTGEPNIRFYAGAPLVTASGHALGTLCVLDTRPRALDPAQRAALLSLARLVVAQIELRADGRRAAAALAAAPDGIVTLDAQGRVREWNPAAGRIFGWTQAEAAGRGLADMIAPERLRADPGWRLAPDGGARAEVTAVRRDGEEFPLELTVLPSAGGWTAFGRDLSAQRGAEDRLRMLVAAVENANDVILITEAEPLDLPGPRVVYVNDAFSRMTGYAPEEILGRTPRILQGPETCPETREYLRRKLLAWEPVEVELLNYRKDGSTFWSQLNIRPVADERGWYTHWVSVQRDVTERRRAEETERAAARRREEELERRVAERTGEIARLSQRTQLLLDSAGEGFYGVDREGRATFVNPAGADMLGYRVEDMLGLPAHDALHHSRADGTPFPRALCPVHATLTGGAVRRSAPGDVFWRKDGTSFAVEYVSTPVREAGALIGAVVTFRDITDRLRLEAEQARLLAEALERADLDPLTGLLNHRAFQKKLEEEADRAQREGGALLVAILDLDNFKFFNDAYGHAAGDDVLRQVAGALRAGCRSYDTLGRFGGDEFVLLMPQTGVAGAGQSPAEATAAIEGRLARLGYRPPGYDAAIPIVATVGVAAFPAEAATRADVLALADGRLRRSKSGDGGAEDLIARLHARLPASSANGFAMLSALVTAVDTKDRYTRRHSEDVLTYSLQIAEGLGLGGDDRQAVALAALLHDVGKVGVPDKILRKPGRLSDAEAGAIRQHPVMGAAIVGAVPGFEDTLDAVRHHHERWDGAGYPGGLRGEDTPLIARLMAVADAFSAMTTDRPYRKGMTESAALARLAEGAGTQWDPACVRAFLRARGAPAGNLERPVY